MAVSRRDHLVDTALALFQRDGIGATGIDRILAEAGVAKMTLYNHFRSKDELVLAALRRSSERFRRAFARTVERRSADPRGRLLAVFDVLEDWFAGRAFRGCLFVNAAAEYRERDHPVHMVAAEHKRATLAYLRQLAAAAGARDADALAYALVLLMEGAIAMAHVAGSAEAAGRARDAAASLVDDALAPPAAA
jgi:AcrR family transcriptional regulator